MASTNFDHNYYAQSRPGPLHTPPRSHSDHLNVFASDTDPQHVPRLPPEVHHQPSLLSSVQSSVTGDPLSISANSSDITVVPRQHQSSHRSGAEDDSPDPHDFYRQFKDPFTGDQPSFDNARNLLTGPIDDDGMSLGPSRFDSSLPRPTPPHSKRPPSATRQVKAPTFRAASVPPPSSSARDSPGSIPVINGAPRSRQTSLKDLVDRFNQYPDEVLPLPARSRQSSTGTISPTPRSARARPPSASKNGGRGKRPAIRDAARGNGHPTSPSRSSNTKISSAKNIKGTATKSPKPERSKASAINNPWASQSMTNLHLSQNESARQPLFGEVLTLAPGLSDLGFGIPSRDRRGSHGSVHLSPPHGHARSRSDAEVTPSSPTGWYLGVRSTPNGLHPEYASIPSPRSPHRRTRSDYSGNATAPNRVHADRYAHTATPLTDVTTTSSPQSPSPRTSKIPVRQRAVPSEPRTSSDSLRKGTSDRMSHSHDADGPMTPRRGSRHHEAMTGPQRGSSPRLKAFISAPLPKKSPPLRSSRPRQPVSSASTSSSRGKVVDRYPLSDRGTISGRESRASKDGELRPRNLPELGNVDFAARRDKIQRAFTKRVGERERKEEREAKKRQAAATDGQKAPAIEIESESSPGRAVNEPTATVPPSSSADGELTSTANGEPTGADVPSTNASASHKKDLSIDTTNRSAPSWVDSSMNPMGPTSLDSPTLGMPGSFPQWQTPPFEQDEPNLAVMTPSSTATAETATTPIDADPQISRHRTVLSQVMQMRGRSPLSISRSRLEDSGSDEDDQESVQIMLRGSPLEERTKSAPDFPSFPSGQDRSLARESQARSMVTHNADDVHSEMTAKNADGELGNNMAHPTGQLHRLLLDELQPKRGQATIDSETYSNINKILEHYHNPDGLSPEVVHSFQQQLLTESPDLARRGGWDSTRVTQLWLQHVGRARPSVSKNPHAVAESDDAHTTEPATATTQVVHSDHPQSFEAPSTDIDTDGSEREPEDEPSPGYLLSRSSWISGRRTDDDGTNEHHVAAPEQPGLEVPEMQSTSRASLQFADDWTDASPSIVDWIHPQAADSPVSERLTEVRPVPPPKDGMLSPQSIAPSDSISQAPFKGSARDDLLAHPTGTSSSHGLGLRDVEDDHTHGYVTLLPPPPLPNHSPPPPPVPAGLDDSFLGRGDRAAAAPSPSVYSRYPRSSTFDTSSQEGIMQRPRVGPTSTSGSRTSSSVLSGRARSSSSPQFHERTSAGTGRSIDSALLQRTSVEEEQRRLTKRRHLLQELVDTEKSFHADMQVTDEIYRGTAPACSGLTPDDVRVLFGNVDQIVAFSQAFYDSVRRAVMSVYDVRSCASTSQVKRASAATANSVHRDEPGVNDISLSDDDKDRRTFLGEAIMPHVPRMERVFGDYIRNTEAANKRLQKLQAQSTVTLWLNECASHAEDLTGAWSLDSLIVKPMQRVLKYPLLLKSLMQVTPADHPDHAALDRATREMELVSCRIDQMMKRVDLVEQAVGRKRKESDVRMGLSKAFGRRTEKLKQHVGLSEMVSDKDFDHVAEKWDAHYIQLQLTMGDVERYLTEVEESVQRCNDYAAAIETFLDVGPTNHAELESKWRKFARAIREITGIALGEHKAAVQRSVIGPMKTLLKMYDGPPKMMQKRNKRIMDYARYKATTDRGDKADKRTQEQAEQYLALNETLKDELPKLYGLTAKLADACLGCFVEIQGRWQMMWQEKLKSILDLRQSPGSVSDILSQFSGDFGLTEAQVLLLGICNGSILADSFNFLTPSTTVASDEVSARRAYIQDARAPRNPSLNSTTSPILPAPDFGQRHSGGFFSPFADGLPALSPSPYYNLPTGSAIRTRTSSTQSSQGGPVTPDMSSHSRSFYAYTPGSSSNPSNPARPSTSTGRSQERAATNPTPRRSIDSPSVTRPVSGSMTYFSAPQDPPYAPHHHHRGNNTASHGAVPNGTHPPSQRPTSHLFTSALPMTDSPRSSPHVSRPPTPPAPAEQQVLFVCASMRDFHIDGSRTEGGYPWLTYVGGEVFDVLAEKGELWLARNQDDKRGTVGWLWCRHCVRL